MNLERQLTADSSRLSTPRLLGTLGLGFWLGLGLGLGFGLEANPNPNP
jgi:hypothetical protein